MIIFVVFVSLAKASMSRGVPESDLALRARRLSPSYQPYAHLKNANDKKAVLKAPGAIIYFRYLKVGPGRVGAHQGS